MNGIYRLWEVFLESLRVFGEKFMETIPGLLLGIVVLLIAWILARLVSSGFQRLLETVKFDHLAEKLKITHFLRQANLHMSPSAIIGRCIYWIFVLLIIASAADTLHWEAVSSKINRIVDYIPNFISAVLFFVVGAYFATFIRDFLRGATGSLGISTGKIISSAIYYLLFIIVALTSMQQAGIDTRILSDNLLIIIGSIMAAAAISYGFASRTVLAHILAGFFNKRTFHKGMIIEIDGVRGMIVEMSNIATTIQVSESERVVIPSQELLTNKVKIIK